MSRGATTARGVRSTSLRPGIVVFVGTVVLYFVGLFTLDQGAKYGKVAIPGSQVLHLPEGEVDLSFGAQLLSSGSGNDYLPVPSLRYSILPVRGGLVPGSERSVGASTSINGNAHRRFAKIDVPAAGDYTVTASGGVSAFFDPTLQFGAPSPAPNILLVGGTLVFWLMLVASLARLLQVKLSVTPADGQASGPMALGAPVPRAGRGALRRYRGLTVAVIGSVALPALLPGGGKLHISPQGRATASGELMSGSSASSGQVDLSRVALTRPTGANVIGAASAGSLFRSRNLVPVLSGLTRRLGANASITDLAIYPGEVDLVVDDSAGMLRRVRVERDGTITEGPPSPVVSTLVSVYMSQFDAKVPQTLAGEIATSYRVPVRTLDRMVLVTNLPGGNAGWQIYAASPMGRPTGTFAAILDGANLVKTP